MTGVGTEIRNGVAVHPMHPGLCYAIDQRGSSDVLPVLYYLFYTERSRKKKEVLGKTNFHLRKSSTRQQRFFSLGMDKCGHDLHTRVIAFGGGGRAEAPFLSRSERVFVVLGG